MRAAAKSLLSAFEKAKQLLTVKPSCPDEIAAQKALKDAGGTGQEIFASLDELLNALTNDLEEMRTESGRMALSAKLKHCGIDTALRHAAWMNGM